jgi:hypothetical protein
MKSKPQGGNTFVEFFLPFPLSFKTRITEFLGWRIKVQLLLLAKPQIELLEVGGTNHVYAVH